MIAPTALERAYVDAARRDDQKEVARLEALIDAQQAEKEARLTSPTALKDAATWYASQGWPVFPCQPGGKRPATAHGFRDASTDVDQIRAWWKVNPSYNVGLPTGGVFDVFDVDGPEGVRAIGNYIDTGEFPPTLAVALTPRGRHLYVPATGRGNTTNLLPKVDYRGQGGYVIAAPSSTPEGTYRWATPPATT